MKTAGRDAPPSTIQAIACVAANAATRPHMATTAVRGWRRFINDSLYQGTREKGQGKAPAARARREAAERERAGVPAFATAPARARRGADRSNPRGGGGPREQ